MIVEEIISNDDVIEAIQGQLTNARLCSTARSSAFEVKFSEIRHLFSAEVKVIDINKLTETDIDSLIKILDTGAYWRNFPDARTMRAKRRIIERKCRNELSSILLGIVESEALDQRIRGLFQNKEYRNSPAQRVIILALCFNVVEMRPTFEFLSELLGMDVFSVMATFNDEYIRQFFSISGIEVLARSPLMSSYLLKNLVSDDVLIEVAVSALRASSERFLRAKRYRELNSKFTHFSFIEQLIISADNKYTRIQDFYDQVGDIGYKEFSPHYWLQYAIAARSYKDYRAADRYFVESKKIAAGRRNFDTYQIDNAYAQFLLESRMDTDYWSDFFDAFVEVSNLAMRQTYIKKAGMYPYRVVANFLRYLEIRGAKFSKTQKGNVADICKSWSARIDGLQPGLRRNAIIKRARLIAADSYDLITELEKT